MSLGCFYCYNETGAKRQERSSDAERCCPSFLAWPSNGADNYGERNTALSVAPTNSEPSPSEPQLPVFRFRLKHLFWCVTGTCLLLAALVIAGRTGDMKPLAILLAVLVVILHVAGTAIGLRMKQHADRRRAWEKEVRFAGDTDEMPQLPAGALATTSLRNRPRSPLHVHDRPLRQLRLFVAAGAAVGGCLGVAALLVLIGNRTTVAGIVVGAVSTAVMGAWFAFVAANSWTIFRQGWRDAVDAAAPEDGREA